MQRVKILAESELERTTIKKIPLVLVQDKIFSHDASGSQDFDFEGHKIKTSSFQISGLDWWKPVFNLDLKHKTYETWDYEELNFELGFLDKIPDPLVDKDGNPKIRKMKFEVIRLYLFSGYNERFEVIVD